MELALGLGPAEPESLFYDFKDPALGLISSIEFEFSHLTGVTGALGVPSSEASIDSFLDSYFFK